MQTINSLSPEWRQWILDNLARGCTHESLVQSMVENRFDAAFAQASVQQLHEARLNVAQQAAAGVASDYVYQTPRLPQSGNVIATSDHAVRVALRIREPVVALFDNFMLPQECDELIRLASAKLERSTVVDPQTGQSVVIAQRSSEGTYFQRDESDFIRMLDRRIAEVMHWPMENGEGIQILHYGVGGEYQPHFDYFPADQSGSNSHLSQGGQRVSTLVMYLNDVQEGGGTSFPSIGVTVTPKKGAALYFEYCNGLGQTDPLTLHSGDPVIAGEKWIATKWMRQQRYG